MLLHHPTLFLASKSPRRQGLLRAAGIQFELLDVDVPEDFPEDMNVEEVPEFLAMKKAEAGVPLISEGQIILAADSVVILHNEIYNKPNDREHAIEMLRNMEGHKHLVITGVFIGDKHRGISFSDHTHVWIDPMTQEEIEYYVDTARPFDKAGSYGIQDWLGWTKVSRIEGSFANVMGLPVHKVYEELKKWNED